MAITTFRDTIRDISPRWLQKGLAEKILYSIAIQLDAIGDATVAGVKKRFPLVAGSNDALSLAVRSRKMRRGPLEPAANFANRLIPWLDDHRTRGGPYALLRQLFAFWASSPLDSYALVYESGQRFYVDPVTGEITRSTGGYWDGDHSHWARWWLLLGWPGTITDDGIWSDPGLYDDGGVWNYGFTAAEVANIRLIPSEWNAAHARGYATLITAGIELWDYPPGLWSDPGIWGNASDIVATISLQ